MKPAFDPALPPADRALMAASPEFLHPVPGRPRWGGRIGADAWAALLSASLWGFLPVVIGRLHGRWWFPLGATLQVVQLMIWFFYGFALAFTMSLAVEAVAFLVLLGLSGESPVAKLARKHQGRYIADLHLRDAELLERTQKAVAAVLESSVNRAGLLDDIANTVTLPRQEWEIAETLAEMTRLRREQRAARKGKVTDRIKDMLDAHQSAMKVATDSLTERVEALEDYALRVMAADDAYQEWKTLQELADDGDAYTELLARTVRDRLATEEIDALTEKAARVEAALRESVRDARKAGLVLLPKAG
ncbi:hypothetical protein [Herbidospora sp. NBRC 101105]|uniref:hypothetical protein n=1 Tax=Herbidospora sp. NBRC 101105 TaxID=3032195 RepID=UPI0024A33FAA|nr:hypothetical protein [Herbidospora sp. NBRC 101105]GLX95779.1 hypothetical protein Hesp01_37290 [Herbidospora sp. NBRC 101105]